MPKDENKKTVRQKDADELHVTNTPSPTAPSTIVEQSDPSKLKATVTQAAKDRTITGNVGILDSLDARINPAKEDGNLASIKTNTDNLDITTSAFRDAIRGANTKDFSTVQTVLDSIKDTDGIKKITDAVTLNSLPTGDNTIGRVKVTDGTDILLIDGSGRITVVQAEKDRTISGNVGLLTSGDVRINPAKEDGNLSSIKTNTDNLDITLSSFRDALRGANTKDFSTVQTVLDSIKDTDGIKKITDTVTVSATDLDIRDLAKTQDEVYAVLKTDAGVAYDARDRSWTITETIPVTGTFWQVTQPVSATDLDIRDLTAVSDNVAAYLFDGAGTALTSTLVGADQALDINIVQSVALAVTGTFWQELQPVTGTVTVTDISSIKTAVEKIDNQEDNITYVHVLKSAVDGDIVAAPGIGYRLRIHHIYVNNAGVNVTTFDIEDGTSEVWRFCLAANGGAVAQNLKRPWDLEGNRALRYDYLAGLLPNICITIGYERISA